MVERFTNGGFETGDFSNWSVTESQQVTLEVSTENVHDGVYSLHTHLNGGPIQSGRSMIKIAQTIDMTDVDSVSFWFSGDNLVLLESYVDGWNDPVWHSWGTGGTWVKFNRDVSGYSGYHSIEFRAGNRPDNSYQPVAVFWDSFSGVTPSGEEIRINIDDVWKSMTAMKINIDDTWKDVVSVKQSIGDTWKTVF